MSRTINTKTAHSPALKELAGRIQKLSYRDMQGAADMLRPKLGESGNIAEALLAFADEVVPPGADPYKVMRGGTTETL